METGMAERTVPPTAKAGRRPRMASPKTTASSSPWRARSTTAMKQVVWLQSLTRRLIDRRRPRIGTEERRRSAGRIDGGDFLLDVGSPLDVHTEPIIGADDC